MLGCCVEYIRHHPLSVCEPHYLTPDFYILYNFCASCLRNECQIPPHLQYAVDLFQVWSCSACTATIKYLHSYQQLCLYLPNFLLTRINLESAGTIMLSNMGHKQNEEAGNSCGLTSCSVKGPAFSIFFRELHTNISDSVTCFNHFAKQCNTKCR